MIKMFNCILLELLACFALVVAIPVLIAQADQSEFISIDCGLPEGSNYTDENSGIFYTSDAGFTDSGVNAEISSRSNYYRHFWYVRSFPEGFWNCYTLRPAEGKDNKYLIRAHFMYGNYDGKSQLPVFDLYIGEDFWDTVRIQDLYDSKKWEVIHTPTTDYIHVCLLRTGPTIPFISALELRPLKNNIYITQSGSLDLFARWDLGSVSDNNWVRYKDDVYDRMWQPRPADSRNVRLSLSSNHTLNVDTNNFQLPYPVMTTALTPQNSSDSFYMSWEPKNSSDQLYLCLHFAELRKLQVNESRQFRIYLNGDSWNAEFSPPHQETYTIWGTYPDSVETETKYELSLNSTENSTLPPILNAIEIYEVKKFKNSGTDDNDVAAMVGIKSYYRLTRNWRGDPCAPRAFTWEGLGCNYDDYSYRIVSLNLSSSGLTGSISPHMARLTSIQILDLSNNNLKGSVPDFLAELDSLKVLNLAGNNFNGSIPARLLEKSKDGLSLSIDGLTSNTNSDTGKKKNKVVVPIVASTLATFLVAFFVFISMYMIRRRRRKAVTRMVDVNLNKNNATLQNKNWQISYTEVLKITNHFEKVLGKGGFGTVYYGIMGDKEVAVKMLNSSSAQGDKEFQAEANLLMTVHHKNLTLLMGYCNEGTNVGIIYECMANGNLQQHLSELSWEQRLGIAVDVAQGLEYLHHGCTPPIIHRDVKPTNILLNGKFQAKLSDFGLSRVFANQSVTHISINTVAGSPGYIDPEYHSSFKLTEKSDVYSFGVVLLEIITGRPVLDMNRDNRHISRWVVPFLNNGDITTIVDETLKGNFNINAAWKAVELAMSCVSWHSATRPTMNDVVNNLKECFALETSNLVEENSLTGSLLESEYGPLVR